MRTSLRDFGRDALRVSSGMSHRAPRARRLRGLQALSAAGRRVRFGLAAVLGLATLAQTAFAHHSWSRYDSGEVVTIEGEVTKVEWASPHVFMYFTATDEDGTETGWTMEMDPPTLLGRYGLRHDTIQPGMTIKVTGVQARSGAPVMRAVMIELEDGTVHRVSSRV